MCIRDRAYTKEKKLFSGKLNEVYCNLPFNGEKEILVGFGKKEDLLEDDIRKVFFKLGKELIKFKEQEVLLQLPKLDNIKTSSLVKAIVEGFLHSTYKFDKYKSARKDYPEITINLITEEDSSLLLSLIHIWELATFYPVSGSFGSYATRFIDPGLGFGIGWLYWILWILVSSVDIITLSKILHYWEFFRQFSTFYICMFF